VHEGVHEGDQHAPRHARDGTGAMHNGQLRPRTLRTVRTGSPFTTSCTCCSWRSSTRRSTRSLRPCRMQPSYRTMPVGLLHTHRANAHAHTSYSRIRMRRYTRCANMSIQCTGRHAHSVRAGDGQLLVLKKLARESERNFEFEAAHRHLSQRVGPRAHAHASVRAHGRACTRDMRSIVLSAVAVERHWKHLSPATAIRSPVRQCGKANHTRSGRGASLCARILSRASLVGFTSG
jgi:hypothetical protein